MGVAWPCLSFSWIPEGHPGGRTVSGKAREEVTVVQGTEAKAEAREGQRGGLQEVESSAGGQ